MSKDFSPEDFEPIYQQAIVLTIAIQEHSDSSLLSLIPDLTSIHTHLSNLITKASNPDSVLRKRCSDRQGDWLQLQYDLQNTLCEAHDLIESLGEASSYDPEFIDRGPGLEKVGEDLSFHAFLLREFIDSLGVSKLGRKEPALGEIERILLAAVRDERERLGSERIASMADVNRLGGWSKILRLLRDSGVDRSEVERLDTKIKQLICWVLRNEEEITMARDLEGFWEKKEEHMTVEREAQAEEEKDEQMKVEREMQVEEERAWTREKNIDVGNEDGHSDLYDDEYQEVHEDEQVDQVQTEERTGEHIARNKDNDTDSMDSYVLV